MSGMKFCTYGAATNRGAQRVNAVPLVGYSSLPLFLLMVLEIALLAVFSELARWLPSTMLDAN